MVRFRHPLIPSGQRPPRIATPILDVFGTEHGHPFWGGFSSDALIHPYLLPFLRGAELIRSAHPEASGPVVHGHASLTERVWTQLRHPLMGRLSDSAVSSRSVPLKAYDVTRPQDGYVLSSKQAATLQRVRSFEPWYVACIKEGVLPGFYQSRYPTGGRGTPVIDLIPLAAIPASLLKYRPFATVLEELGGVYAEGV